MICVGVAESHRERERETERDHTPDSKADEQEKRALFTQ